MVKADLCHGSTAVEKEKLLREQLSARTKKNRPLIVNGVVVFCNRLLFSQPPDSDGLVSIEVHAAARVCPSKSCKTTVHNEEMDRFLHMETSPRWLDQRQGVHVQYA